MNTNTLLALYGAVVVAITLLAAWQLPTVFRWPLYFGAAFLLFTPYRGEAPINVLSGSALMGAAKTHLVGRFVAAVLMMPVAVALSLRAHVHARQERERWG